MTLNECRREVALLGGDLDAPQFLRFAAALGRAIYTLSCERPRFFCKLPENGQTVGDRRLYDMEAEDAEFLGFAPTPILPPTEYRILGGSKILLPDDGIVYRIFYRKKLPTYTENEGDTVLPLDDDLARLLPLIVAAEVYAEEDGELAANCLALYRTEASAILNRREPPQSSAVRSLNGW